VGSVGHPRRFPEAAALHELQICDVGPVGDSGYVGERDAGLVGRDGERRPVADELEALGVVGGDGLLHEFEVVLREGVDLPDSLAGRPPLVGVHPDGRVRGRRPNRRDDLLVAVGADLHLQGGVPALDRGLGLLAHRLRVVDADGVGSRDGVGGVESPVPVEWHAEALADQIVECDADGAPRGRVALDRLAHPALDAVELVGVAHVLDDRQEVRKEGFHRVGGLAVVFGGCGPADAYGPLVVLDSDDDVLGGLLSAPSDGEGVFEREVESLELGREAHSIASSTSSASNRTGSVAGASSRSLNVSTAPWAVSSSSMSMVFRAPATTSVSWTGRARSS